MHAALGNHAHPVAAHSTLAPLEPHSRPPVGSAQRAAQSALLRAHHNALAQRRSFISRARGKGLGLFLGEGSFPAGALVARGPELVAFDGTALDGGADPLPAQFLEWGWDVQLPRSLARTAGLAAGVNWVVVPDLTRAACRDSRYYAPFANQAAKGAAPSARLEVVWEAGRLVLQVKLIQALTVGPGGRLEVTVDYGPKYRAAIFAAAAARLAAAAAARERGVIMRRYPTRFCKNCETDYDKRHFQKHIFGTCKVT